MNTNSNVYTFIYASVMVIIVAALLSFIALQLQPMQKKNVEIEKKSNILAAIGVASTQDDAEALYKDHVKNSYIATEAGEKTEGDAFTVKMAEEVKKASSERQLPIYECFKNDSTFFVIPLRGKGLWGPVWGYLAFYEDFNTIYGATFDHKGETPGLGADINQDWFEEPFSNKTIFDADGKFVSITTHKGGKGAALAANDTEHGVDAISGGTITCKGLEKMLADCLAPYETYFKKNKK